MRCSQRLATATMDRYPEADTRTLALLCGDAWKPNRFIDRDWNEHGQQLAVEIAEGHIENLRRARSGTAPNFVDHDSFIRDLYHWMGAAGWGASIEASVRINASDRNPKRADLVLGFADTEFGFLLSPPLFVVEVKSVIRTPGQAKAAVEQVSRYCQGFMRERGGHPTPVVVAGDIGERAPRVVDGVSVMSPQEFVDSIGAHEAAEFIHGERAAA